MVHRLPAILLFLLLTALPVAAQVYLPFNKEDNKDNARYVWYIMCKEGYSYQYVPAESIRYVPQLGKITPKEARDGDIVSWKRFVGIYSKGLSGGNNLLTGDGPKLVKNLEKQYGTASWYRYLSAPPRAEYVRAFDSLVTFVNPNPNVWARIDSSMEPDKGKGMTIWLRQPLIDSAGQPIRPSVSVIFSNLPDSIRTAERFAQVSRARLTYDLIKTGTIENTPVHTYHYIDRGYPFTSHTRYMVSGKFGIQFVATTVDELVPKVDADFRKMLRSVKVINNPRAVKNKKKI